MFILVLFDKLQFAEKIKTAFSFSLRSVCSTFARIVD